MTTNPKGTTMKIYILLDRSGSMASRWSEALGAINAYVDGLAGDKGTKKASVTLATFDTVNGTMFEVLRKDESVCDWRPVVASEASPRGGTPLFDAIGRLMGLADADKPKKAAIVIMTDGEENSSREMTRDAAKAALDRSRSSGWSVVFLGADFDATKQAGSVGTGIGQTISTSAGSYHLAAKAMAAHTHSFAATGVVRGFTDDERARAMGKTA